MKKKKVLYVLIFIICLGSLGYGNIQYKLKLEDKAEAAKKDLEDQRAASKERKESSTMPGVSALTKNLPENAQEVIAERWKAAETVKVGAIGSETTSGEDSWGTLFQQKLQAAYGKEHIEFLSKGFKNEWSITVIKDKKYQPLLDQRLDVLLIEPFLLNDNGKINIRDTLASLDILLADVKRANPETVVLLQPPNPIYKPRFYLDQVNQLKRYANEKGMAYIDHWSAWPDQESEELKMYVNTENHQPTKKGEQLWADDLADLFTGK
ncbi:hypothetical protein GA0061096_2230 [Fictibacillus enclensis]|uniref:SGNH hydrolase-type esterase domain-containing protein n=1 Tax=Fictibacillus enclensis TaxID=1017270 RepID=A0A0V8J7I2_9BACL|nr:SGNH/GDSL hydrolase family protein [Fictibacillus enclensis]KSU83038.1 hypothetical protein AS030_10615 [Fictibacillus enclensis]SCC09074.1 hypothetical protein GA0061096_2230 [Fictibacillus enclensis]